MHEQNVVRHQTTEPPIVIRTTGLSVEVPSVLCTEVLDFKAEVGATDYLSE
jgi:hypothetical protein